MLHLRRLRFEAVGHRDARLAPLVLDLSRGDGVPLHTVLWLRNGGGKSSILNLLFALVRPGRREFLGKEEMGKDRRLGDYVLRGDTAHVVAEWARPGEVGPFLVTGMVLEWKDRTPSPDEGRLGRFWYGFTTGGTPELFGGRRSPKLDDLPFLEDGRRLPLSRFRERLRELAAAHPAAELAVATTQTQWREYLERRHFDTEVFRYQLLMNREEGGASSLFKQRCRTDEGFVELLLELAVPPEQPDNVANVFSRYSEQLARRPALERDLGFVTGALARLGPLVTAIGEHGRTAAELEAAAGAAARLMVSLDVAAREAEARRRRHGAEAERLAALANEEETRRRRAGEQRDAARWLSARLTLARAEAEAADSRAAREAAAVVAAAWELVPDLARLEESRAEVLGIEEALDRAERAARPLREQRDAAAAALSSRLAADERASREAAAESDGRAEESERAAAGAAAGRRRIAAERAEREAERKAIRARGRELAALRREAETAGVLGTDETAEEALARVRTEIDRLAESRFAAEARLTAIQVDREEAVAARDAAVADLARFERDLDRVRADLDELDRRLEEIRGSPRFREVAESAEADLFASGEEIAVHLLGLAEAADRRIVEEETTAAGDRRALASLEEVGLLPPRVETERVLALLREAGVPAVPGWRYLADSVRTEVRADLLRAYPEIADGIVVTDPDRLEAAREIVAGAAPLPAGAVVVAVAAPLAGDAPAPSADRFLVPPSPALLDREAAESERDRRRERLSGVDERTALHRETRDRDALLAGGIRSLLREFPEERRIRLREREEGLRAAAEAARTARAGAESVLGRLAAEERDLRESRQRAEARERVLAGHVPRLEDLVRRAAADAVDRARLLRVESILEALAEEDRGAERAGEAAALAARQARDRASEHRSAAARIGERRRELGLPEPSDPAPEEPADALLARFRLLEDRYRERVSDPALRERKAAAEARRSRLAAVIEAARPPVCEKAGELRASPDAADPESRRRALDAARQERDRAIERDGVAADAVRRAREGEEASRPEGTPTELPEPIPETPEAANDLARRLGEEMTAASGRATDHRNAAEREKDRMRDADRDADGLSSAAAELASALAHVDHERPDEAGPFDGDLAAGRAAAKRAQEDLAARILGERNARAVRDRAAEELRTFARAPGFDALEGPLRDRLSRDADAELFARAGELAEDLERRESAIRELLAELSRHRDLLVREIYQQVMEALRILDRAERASVLPEGFRGWSGQRFLHIRSRRPGKDDEVLGRLSRLVDELVERGDKPGGLRLLYRAVNATVGPEGFRVSILKPNAALRADRVRVTDLATFSGGEQLTAAVLLYTTLAMMRGRTKGFGGLLLLDNPVGKSSNVTFLDLQTRVADAAGVQLLYTTAVDDRDAIAAFPHWIRLRNERIDRRTGNGHVEVEEAEDGRSRLSAARLWRRKPTPEGGEG